MKFSILFFLTTLITLSLNNSFAKDANPIVEWAPFDVKEGITEAQLIAASNRLQLEFLSKQKGYIKRSLLKGKGSQWVDIIHWESIGDAHEALNQAASCVVCAEFFALLVMTDPTNASEGIFHYEQIQSWQ